MIPVSENSSSVLAWLQGIREIVIVAATIFGIYAGYRGLLTWWDQLRGKADFELARRILERTYQLRNVIRQVRNPFGFLTQEEVQIPRHEQLRQKFTTMWGEVNEALAELQTAALESEVLWGQEFSEAIIPIRRKVIELYTVIEEYLDSQEPGMNAVVPRERVRELKKMVYFTGGEDDIYTQEFEMAVQNLEQRVRPHIERKSYKLFSRTKKKA